MYVDLLAGLIFASRKGGILGAETVTEILPESRGIYQGKF